MTTAFQSNAFQISGFQIVGAVARRRPIYVVDPWGLSLRDWTEVMTLQLEPLSHVARLVGDDWRRWGAWFCAAPNLSYNHPPSPYDFDDWREWAQSFNNAMAPAGF